MKKLIVIHAVALAVLGIRTTLKSIITAASSQIVDIHVGVLGYFEEKVGGVIADFVEVEERHGDFIAIALIDDNLLGEFGLRVYEDDNLEILNLLRVVRIENDSTEAPDLALLGIDNSVGSHHRLNHRHRVGFAEVRLGRLSDGNLVVGGNVSPLRFAIELNLGVEKLDTEETALEVHTADFGVSTLLGRDVIVEDEFGLKGVFPECRDGLPEECFGVFLVTIFLGLGFGG